MHKSYKYRIYPSDAQKVLLSKTFGCVRLVWNSNVAVFNAYDKETNPSPEYKSSTELRSEYDFMKEISAAALQQKEIDFKRYKQTYFSKSHKSKIGRCSFKKRTSKQSYRLPNQKFTFGNHKIRLEKIGWVDMKVDRRPDKNCKFLSVTVSKDSIDNYFVSVLVDEDIKISESSNRSIGIDMGLTHFITTSDGNKVDNPRWFRESQSRLKRAQQNLSRKKKGSGRYKKCRLKVARIHNKIANQRKWFHHKISLDLVRNHNFIGLEDLSISTMMEDPRLSKSIADAGWYMFINMIEYKAKWHNAIVQKVDRYYPSSKTCGACEMIIPNLGLKDRHFTCENCGAVLDRDINASNNILKESLRIAQGVACA